METSQIENICLRNSVINYFNGRTCFSDVITFVDRLKEEFIFNCEMPKQQTVVFLTNSSNYINDCLGKFDILEVENSFCPLLIHCLDQIDLMERLSAFFTGTRN